MGAGSSLITMTLTVVAFYSRTVSQTQVAQMIKAEEPAILAHTADSAPDVNPTYFLDQVHPNALGHAELEPIFTAVINAL